jgi:hypothetical protein
MLPGARYIDDYLGGFVGVRGWLGGLSVAVLFVFCGDAVEEEFRCWGHIFIVEGSIGLGYL